MVCVIAWTNADGSSDMVSLDVDEDETHVLPAECTKHPVENVGVVTDQVILGNRTLTIAGFVSNSPLPINDPAGSFSRKTLDVPSSSKFVAKSAKLDVPKGPLKPNAAGLVSAGFKALFGGAPEAMLRSRSGSSPNKAEVRVWSLKDPNRNRVLEAFELLKKAWFARIRVDVTTSLDWIPGMVLTNVQATKKVEDGNGITFTVSLEQVRTVSAMTVDKPKPLERLGQKKKSTKNAAKNEQDSKARLQSAAAALLDLALGKNQGH